eukprot:gene11735-biopygen8494
MGCGSSSAKAVDVEYLNGHPTFEGDEVVKCFEKDNGLLFRIMNNKKGEWAYYNDTTDYRMEVKVSFEEGGDFSALGNTKLEALEDGGFLATLIVPPLATEMFIKGKVNRYHSKIDAYPIEEEGREQPDGAAASPPSETANNEAA